MIFRSDHTRWQVRYDDYSTKPCLPLISISLQFSYSLYSVILEFSFVNNLSYRFLTTIWSKWGRNWKIGSCRVWREKKNDIHMNSKRPPRRYYVLWFSAWNTLSMIFCVVSYDTAGQLQFFFRSEYYSILVTYIADNTSSVSNIDDFQMAMALRLVWHSSYTSPYLA